MRDWDKFDMAFPSDIFGEMSAYDNFVTGKLKLKGKALDLKASGMKKKKKQKKEYEQTPQTIENEISGKQLAELNDEDAEKTFGDESSTRWHDHLTPAERRYIEQREKIDSQKLAKTSNKSHRDRIQDFNQYLANMSEHYDIPKVGPG